MQRKRDLNLVCTHTVCDYEHVLVCNVFRIHITKDPDSVTRSKEPQMQLYCLVCTVRACVCVCVCVRVCVRACVCVHSLSNIFLK